MLLHWYLDRCCLTAWLYAAFLILISQFHFHNFSQIINTFAAEFYECLHQRPSFNDLGWESFSLLGACEGVSLSWSFALLLICCWPGISLDFGLQPFVFAKVTYKLWGSRVWLLHHQFGIFWMHFIVHISKFGPNLFGWSWNVMLQSSAILFATKSVQFELKEDFYFPFAFCRWEYRLTNGRCMWMCTLILAKRSWM